MLTLTYAPDGTASWTSGIVLCNTSRSIAELDVKLNHKRVIEAVPGYGAAAMTFLDLANQQNTLTLKVRRGVDFANATFADPEAALVFALDQPAAFPSTGTLRIQLQGVATNITRYLLNCAVEGISLADWLGAAPAFDYTFNGGLIANNSPF